MPEARRHRGTRERRDHDQGRGRERSGERRGGEPRSGEPHEAGERDEGEPNGDANHGPRAAWTGSLAFGLVSVPVELHTAARGPASRMRLLGPDGTPLQRRYRCPAHDRVLADDEIVRGYPIEDGGHVVVEDAELDALAPERSREIALLQFTPHDELPLASIDRTYYLAPRSGNVGNIRGYRLLAAVMEREGLAGIGTFVMRGHAHLVAIVASGGVLRAELLRYAEELRGPDDVDLPSVPAHLPGDQLEPMRRALDERFSDSLDLEALQDDRPDRLQALAEEQLARGEDVVEAPAVEPDLRVEMDDLMQRIKQQLELGEGSGGAETYHGSSGAAPGAAPGP